MKTSALRHVNPLLFSFVFMVLCPGENVALAAGPTQAKAQLHVPWKLLSERLKAIANKKASDGSPIAKPIENRLISVPYDGESINWNLQSGSVAAATEITDAAITPTGASLTSSRGRVHITLNSLVLDQVIEKQIGGATVRVHLNAVCGPIEIDQVAAQAHAQFALDYSSGAPVAKLSSLDLSWAPASWTFNAFACSGPSGVDELVRAGIAEFLRDPAALKSYVEGYVAENLQSSVDASIAQLRQPFAVGAGKDAITINVGTLLPTSTGLIGDLTLRTDSKVLPLPALPAPSDSVLNGLSASQPSLVGSMKVIEFIVATRLAAQASYYRIDLQKIPAFHSLMQSRIKQLFAWKDLWHYPENYPFYLNIYNPGALTLTKSSAAGSKLSSQVPMKSIIQSYRDSKWWTYVNTSGTAASTVAVSVKAGTLSYATTIDSLKIKSSYGSAYAERYDKGKDSKLPDDIVANAIAGPQKDLSGSMKWPDIDLAEAGKYRASSLTWSDKSTFALNFSAL